VGSESSENQRKSVRWSRIRPVVSDWSVGWNVGFFNSVQTFSVRVRVGPLHHRFATLRQSNLVQRDNKGRCSRYLDRDLVGVDADRVTQVLDERPT
jgi:hypothetical protein